MSYDPRRNRRERDHEPVTTGEVARWVERNESAHREEHADIRRLLEQIDNRTDKISTRVSVIFAVVAVLWSIFLVLAPFIRAVLGIPNG